jgi:membrane dipeptidase
VSERELRARDLLRRFPLIDGHNDLPWELRERGGVAAVNLAEPVDGTHTDLPRLAAGGVGAQFWSVFVPATLAGDGAVATVLEQIDLARRMIAGYPRALELALTADDVERIFASGRVASLLGAEGGHAIADSLGVLRMLYALGVRYMTLTHNANVGWADSATDEPAAGGLTDFGRDVVREMQRIGMLVDLSHVSPDTMHDALEVAEAPVIFSHSSARAVCDNPRNVPDDVLARLAGNGGVCMVTFVPGFVSQQCADWLAGLKAEAARRGLDPKDFAQLFSIRPEWEAAHPRPEATLAQVASHVEHVRRVAGVEHVGLGGDFDGTPDVTVGLEDVSAYPALFAELLARGWTESDCAALAGGNLLRALREAESFAARARSLPQREALALGSGTRAGDTPVPPLDRNVIDAGLATAHQPVAVELPQLVPVAAPPLAGPVATLVLETHGDAVAAEGPEFIALHVVELAFPFLDQEPHDLVAPGDEEIAVAPDRVLGAVQADPARIACVPHVLVGLHLLPRGLLGERRHRRASGHGAFLSCQEPLTGPGRHSKRER